MSQNSEFFLTLSDAADATTKYQHNIKNKESYAVVIVCTYIIIDQLIWGKLDFKSKPDELSQCFHFKLVVWLK